MQQMAESGIAISAGERVLTNSDSTIAGFVLEQHLPLFKSLLRHRLTAIRLSTLQLIGTLLRQGMICPMDIIADIIMLQGDTDETLRAESLKLLQTQDERYPTFLESRMLEGVDFTFDFQLTTFGEVNAFLPLGPRGKKQSLFSPLFLTCIQTTRKRKINFLLGLLRRCTSGDKSSYFQDIKIDRHSVKNKVFEDHSRSSCTSIVKSLYKIDFLVMTLAALPYSTMEEVMLMIEHIVRVVPVEMSFWLGSLRSVFQSIGVELSSDGTSHSVDVGADTPLAIHDVALEFAQAKADPVALTGLLSEMLADHAQSIWTVIVGMVQACANLRALEALLRLKAYLKASFGIDNERCREFRPDDKSLANEKLNLQDVSEFIPRVVAAQGDMLKKLSDRKFGVFLDNNGSTENLDELLALVHQCVEDFNRMTKILQMDPNDFVLGDEPTKRKKVSSSASLKRQKHSSTPSVGRKKSRRNSSKDLDDDDDDGFGSDNSSFASKSSSRASMRATKKRAKVSPVDRGCAEVEHSVTRQRTAKKSINYAMLADLDEDDFDA